MGMAWWTKVLVIISQVWCIYRSVSILPLGRDTMTSGKGTLRDSEWCHPIWNCSQNLVFARIARARNIFASARMLGFSLKFPALKRKHNLHLQNKNWHWKQCFLFGKLRNIGKTCALWMFLEKCYFVLGNPTWNISLVRAAGLSLILLRGYLLACRQGLILVVRPCTNKL